MKVLFCPKCGCKLLEIGKANTGRYVLEDKSNSLVREWEKKWYRSMGSSFEEKVTFVACHKCKHLVVTYYVNGWRFEYLGELTDEFIRVLIAAGLKEATAG